MDFQPGQILSPLSALPLASFIPSLLGHLLPHLLLLLVVAEPLLLAVLALEVVHATHLKRAALFFSW